MKKISHCDSLLCVTYNFSTHISTHAFQQHVNHAGNLENFGAAREKKLSHVKLPTAFHGSHHLFICFLLSHGKSHLNPKMCYCWGCKEEIDSISAAGVEEFRKVIYFFSSSPDSRLSSNCSLSIQLSSMERSKINQKEFLEAGAGILFKCWSNIILNTLFCSGLESACVWLRKKRGRKKCCLLAIKLMSSKTASSVLSDKAAQSRTMS